MNYFYEMTPATCIILLALLFSAGAYQLYRFQLLTFYGSVFTGLFGFYLSGFPGMNWILPVLYFFFTSVFFTRLNSRLNKKENISAPRNVWQVLANILPAILVAVFYQITGNEIYILFFIALIAAVTADTWASEIGPVLSKKCISLQTFRKAEAGISGGISLAGSLAALAGAASVSIIAGYLFFSAPDLALILFLSVSALLASFVDSFLGAFWEPKLLRKNYFNDSGESITPNDLVNFFASISAPLFLLLLLSVFNRLQPCLY